METPDRASPGAPWRSQRADAPPPSPRAPGGGWGQWGVPFRGGGPSWALGWILLTWASFCSFEMLSCHLLLKREKGRAPEEMEYSFRNPVRSALWNAFAVAGRPPALDQPGRNPAHLCDLGHCRVLT